MLLVKDSGAADSVLSDNQDKAASEFTAQAFPTLRSHTWIMWNSRRRAVNCPSG